MSVTDPPANASAETPRRGGRPPAGTDPHKRGQILLGAGRVFETVGFDAASMNDVAREAGVSKATLYVYFEDKERLFAAVCAERRDRNITEIIALLDHTAPIPETLHTFGAALLERLSQPFVVAAHRIVIGVGERMPDVTREFFEAGPRRLSMSLATYIEHHVQAGALRVDDSYLAAAQFLELAQATVFRPRLYGILTEPPSRAEVDKVVGGAVTMFLATYAVR